MLARLLNIDCQKDFCDIARAALPVNGANEDMHCLAAFMYANRSKISELILTLDSHPSVAIERPTFWRTGDGQPVAPFTQITAEDVLADRYVPRGAVSEGGREGHPSLVMHVLSYLHALEAGGRYRLMVWPVHCELGTWGHTLHDAIAEEVAAWEFATQKVALRVLKGLNPMTEQYSAVRAEVPDPKDPSTQTNHKLIGRARPKAGEILLIAGEASSHCVAATTEHLIEAFTREERARIVVLKDCMSPVAGFEAQVEKFFEEVRSAGGRIMTATQAQELLAA